MDLFTTPQELIAAFGDVTAKGFYGPIILNDTPVGFSVKKDYPLDIRFKPAIGQQSNKPDNIAVIWVVYTANELRDKEAALFKAPLRLRVSMMSKYRTSHFDYNFDDKDGDCPTKKSLEASLATPQPIELNFEDVYFYDHINEQFIHENGDTLSGAAVLQQIFDSHCNTVHLMWGLKLRLKLAWQSKFSGVLTLIVELLTWILKKVFGRTIESDVMMAGLYEPYKSESFKKLDEDSIELLGYKASKHVVVLFCLIVIFASAYRYYFSIGEDYISSLEGQEFLTLTHGILGVWLIDSVIPMLLFILINLIIRLKKKVTFMKFSAK